MTRAEFIQITCDFIAQGRKRNFPALRPSEASAARVSDQKKALSLWRQSRDDFANMLPGIYLQKLRDAQTKNGEA